MSQMVQELRNCSICDTHATGKLITADASYKFDCPRCGKYRIKKQAIEEYIARYKNVRQNVALLSYWTRKNESYLITVDDIAYIMNNVTLPSVKEQADNVILWTANHVSAPNEKIETTFFNLCSVIGCVNTGNSKYIMQHLFQEKLIIATYTENDITYQLSFKGWMYSDEIKRSTKESKIAFMAMEYNNARLEELFNSTLKEAVKEAGFELRRLDEEPRAGIIDNLLRVEIRRAKFLVADLSTDNRGAYWEAGFAEGLGKEVIYICNEAKFKEIHFDTNHCQTVPFNWEDLEDFKKRLKATIRATFPDEAIMDDKD